MQLILRFIFLAGIIIAAVSTSNSAIAEPMNVGVKEAPPFSMQNADGSWTGMSVDLWNEIAEESGFQTTFVRIETVPEMLQGLEAGTFDVGVGALTMNAEREQLIDFSYAFLSSGIGVAVSTEPAGIWHSLADLWTLGFFKAIGTLMLLLCAVGFGIWLVEHKRNEQFSGDSALTGIGNGFWWSAVTMTTVGYGDKAPITPLGRILGVIWMFAGVITISGFTAAIAASFTTSSMTSKITSIGDLPKATIVTLGGSSSATLLDQLYLEYSNVENLRAGFRALVRGEADALVHDEPLLRYVLQGSDHGNLVILGQSLAKSDYAFGLRPGFEKREAINRALLQKLDQKNWTDIKDKYLGTSSNH